MKRFKAFMARPLYKWTLIICGIIFVLLLWWLISACLKTSLFPDPWVTIGYMFEMLGEGLTWQAIGETLLRLIIALALCFVLALIIGVLAGLLPSLYTFLSPLIEILRMLPTAAIIFVLICLFQTEAAIFSVTFLLIFPILYEAVAGGIRNISKETMDMLRLDGPVYRPNSLFRVILPMSGPYVAVGVVQSLSLGLKVTLMAEILCGNSRIHGLGRLIYQGSQIADMKQILAVVVMCLLIMAVIDLILHFVKKALPDIKI